MTHRSGRRLARSRPRLACRRPHSAGAASRPATATGRIIRRWSRRPVSARRSASAVCRIGSPRLRAIDAAEAFRDLHGLVLLESARPGRNARWTYLTADPVAVLESPAAGPDPFAVARRLVARLDRTLVVPADAPPFLGGLVGFLGYDLGAMLERLPAIAPADQDLPMLRLALHDWVVAWDRKTGHAWIGGRALDGDGRRLARRLDDVHARLVMPPRRAGRRRGTPMTRRRFRFRSGMDRATYEAGVSRIRDHIARGDLYQANLTRRLEAAVRRRPVAALPAPADRRSVAVLGVRRSRAGAADRASARAPLRLAGAVPVGRCRRRRQDRSDQGHASARPRRRGGSGARAASSSAAPRTAPRT